MSGERCTYLSLKSYFVQCSAQIFFCRAKGEISGAREHLMREIKGCFILKSRRGVDSKMRIFLILQRFVVENKRTCKHYFACTLL